MTGKDRPTETALEDDAPDLATPCWRERFAGAKVRGGRPKAAVTKVSITIRLDSDVVGRFKGDGPGWQGRVNEALRKAAGLG